ncbi:MAG: sugar transferase [Bacilli bacterium]
MVYRFIKYTLDIILSYIGFILLLPLIIIISILIKITSKGPVFFKQKRVGKNKKLFTIYKFRTMRVDTPSDSPTHLLRNPDKYITKVGKFLRKTSLDEIPQIINIMFGQMSIIGPRPALWNQYDLIDEREKYGVNNLKPGLTGWAQINGRDELEIPDKAALDGEYVKRQSLFFDIRIFFGTFISILKSDGVVEGGTGNKKDNTDEKLSNLENNNEYS